MKIKNLIELIQEFGEEKEVVIKSSSGIEWQLNLREIKKQIEEEKAFLESLKSMKGNPETTSKLTLWIK